MEEANTGSNQTITANHCCRDLFSAQMGLPQRTLVKD